MRPERENNREPGVPEQLEKARAAFEEFMVNLGIYEHMFELRHKGKGSDVELLEHCRNLESAGKNWAEVTKSTDDDIDLEKLDSANLSEVQLLKIIKVSEELGIDVDPGRINSIITWMKDRRRFLKKSSDDVERTQINPSDHTLSEADVKAAVKAVKATRKDRK